MSAAPILAHLESLPGARRVGTSWTARCPAHEDRSPSLSWTLGDDGRVLVHCHAGCPAEAVVAAVGGDMHDLFVPRPPSGRVGGRRVRSAVAYPLRGAGGDLEAVHVRTDFTDGSKTFAWQLPGGVSGLHGRARKSLPLYGSERVADFDPGRPVFVVEGEKCADHLTAAGVQAVAIVTGAPEVPFPEPLAVLAGRRVILWPDADPPGIAQMRGAARLLPGSCAIEWVDPTGWPAKYDAADLLDGKDADAARAALRDVERRIGPVPDGPGTADVGDAPSWPEPEDRGLATLSALGEVDYVEDLIRPGRIVVWAAEEGTGKSYAVDGELAIRLAVAGGSFAGTWPVVTTGPVLYLSEMHGDDDYRYEDAVLGSLGLDRAALAGRLYRLPLMTAAHGAPVLTDPDWCEWITGWLRDHGALLMIVDTATGATMVDPWGKGLHEVYGRLRVMLGDYPALAVVLVLHLKKPVGSGERRISDVLGEWGRWCDVVVVHENDGASLDRARISVRKRVRQERRIVATKAGGLLVNPIDATKGRVGTKVPVERVLAVIGEVPGITRRALADRLGVDKDTAAGYVKALGERVDTVRAGRQGTITYFLTDEPTNTDERARFVGPSSVPASDGGNRPTTDEPTYRDTSVVSSVGTPDAPDLVPNFLAIFGDDVADPTEDEPPVPEPVIDWAGLPVLGPVS